MALKESISIIFYTILLMSSPTTFANGEFNHPEVDKLMNSNEEPEGVVFELLEWEENTWKWASPMISSLRTQLQFKFPGIEIAIVSHGDEQFELTKSRKYEQPSAMSILKDMTMDGVSLHVCGVNSSWNNVGDDEYLDMVDVAVSGPAKINDYIMLGFDHIIIQR